MNRTLLYIFALLLFFSSCKKQIEGNVIDNFGQPLSNVNIEINNTQFKTQTGTNGTYSLDYASGEFVISFKKEGYIGFEDYLNITEQQKYPYKDVVLTKYPDAYGIYINEKDAKEYIPITQTNLVKKKQADTSRRNVGGKTILSLSENEEIQTIKIESLDDIHVYVYTPEPYILVEPNDQNSIGYIYPTGFSKSIKLWSGVKESTKKLTSKMQRRTFKPEYGKTYVYANVYIKPYSSVRYSTKAYAFKFEQL